MKAAKKYAGQPSIPVDPQKLFKKRKILDSDLGTIRIGDYPPDAEVSYIDDRSYYYEDDELNSFSGLIVYINEFIENENYESEYEDYKNSLEIYNDWLINEKPKFDAKIKEQNRLARIKKKEKQQIKEAKQLEKINKKLEQVSKTKDRLEKKLK